MLKGSPTSPLLPRRPCLLLLALASVLPPSTLLSVLLLLRTECTKNLIRFLVCWVRSKNSTMVVHFINAHSPAKPSSVSRQPNLTTKECNTSASPTETGIAESTASPTPLRHPTGEHASCAYGLFSSPKWGARRRNYNWLQRAPAAAAGPGTWHPSFKVPTGPQCQCPLPAASPVTVYSPSVASLDGDISCSFEAVCSLFVGCSKITCIWCLEADAGLPILTDRGPVGDREVCCSVREDELAKM